MILYIFIIGNFIEIYLRSLVNKIFFAKQVRSTFELISASSNYFEKSYSPEVLCSRKILCALILDRKSVCYNKIIKLGTFVFQKL